MVSKTQEEASDDPEAAVLWAAEQLQRAVAAIPQHLKDREDGIVKRLKFRNASAVSKTRELQELADHLLTAVAPFTPCRSGCSACCHYPVMVSEADVAIIESKTTARRLLSPLPKVDFMGTPCPFLRDGQCSIYAYRPLVCRMHVAFTPTSRWCAPEMSPKQEMPLLRFSGIEEARNGLGMRPPLDIRQVFGAAIWRDAT